MPGTPDYDADVREARRVCAGCGVRQRCLDFALDRRIPAGVFGGATPTERTAVARRREREARERWTG